MKINGLLLAGGESRRFGSPKAFATINGLPFYRIVLNQLLPIVSETAIIAKKDLMDRFTIDEDDRVTLLTDNESFVGMGPLAGIYSAMEKTEGDYYVTVACDMPLLTEGLLSMLINEMMLHPDAVAIVPVKDGRVQPLCAIYHSSCENVIKNHLQAGRKRMIDLLNEIKVHYVSVNASNQRHFMNVNTIDEYEILQKEID
ncbi:molybdenum cofactor guanylyltransferase [Pseudalkalibacillus hwajinpoensis]|uniref:Probable molybdenum cofactor guanylyltransferase n=1 Tax=Guptibacillus hwajinpoensis TaxID=208199 RepID=A0A4U1MI43_9BACL|nr:molybdenum cofactor guanylyltransferase [Pseudalkalibacillus hwajinpoensis]TKD70122.1 molybdenum cofactor guanylyltransferase [Pseudalkalibacillus hwajinpoensis]